MERRTFLKTSALAAGAALLEGCARQDEIQFLEMPAGRRRGLQGASVWNVSTCGQCAAGCGVRLRTVDGNAKKVEGIVGHPVNRGGGLCALGQASIQGLYNPDRITVPQRIVDGSLDPIDWESALGQAAEALSVAGENVAIVLGNVDSVQAAIWRRLAKALGAPPPAVLRPADEIVERQAAAAVLGSDAAAVLGSHALPAYDLENSDYALSIGPAFLDRWRSPVHYTGALTRMRSGTAGRRGKLVQAECRFSLTAAAADEWLPVRPGTEALLARALAGVLLELDPDSEGAATYRSLFPEAPPDLLAAAEECGLRSSQLRRIAGELAAAQRPVVLAGGSAALTTAGLAATSAALALNHLLGSVGRPGGVYLEASYDLGASLADPAETPLAEVLNRLESDTITTLLTVDADLLHTQTAASRWQTAIARASHRIALAAFPDDTTMAATLALPIQVDLERFNLIEPPAMVRPSIGLAKAAVQPEGESRHPVDIGLALATALDKAADFPWASMEDVVTFAVEAQLDNLPGGAGTQPLGWVEETARAGFAASADAPPRIPPGPTGTAITELGADWSAGEFDLLVFESPKFGDGRGANRPWLQELPDTFSTVMWGAWVEIAESDAATLGIETGDRLEISSSAGTVEVDAVLSPPTRPGTLSLPLGLGHHHFGRYAEGRGANALDLLVDADIAGTTAKALISTRVKLRRLGPGRPAIFGRGMRDEELIPSGWKPHIVDPRETS